MTSLTHSQVRLVPPCAWGVSRSFQCGGGVLLQCFGRTRWVHIEAQEFEKIEIWSKIGACVPLPAKSMSDVTR